ncbi:MAG: hypothetical protein RSF92_03000 [Niameybacter sp.]|uniref:hypothetical protein n=1 Tax=Niameybacter sp. TaxID=2033640 RepID=UPI002FCBAC9D
MSRKSKYKIFNTFSGMLAVAAGVMMLSGVGYASWSDTLTVAAKVSTGNVRVEGVVNAYGQIGEYPLHKNNGSWPGDLYCQQGEACTFAHWWQEQDSSIFIDNQHVNTGPITIENLSLDVGTYEDEIIYTGTADLVTRVKNTGAVRAQVRLNEAEHGYKNTWIKLSAPMINHESDPNSRSTLAQGIVETRHTGFAVEKNGVKQSIQPGGSFELSPGEEAEVRLLGCELKTIGKNNDPDYDASQLNLEQLRIEAQISFAYQDPTGSWYDNTCNSLFINRAVSHTEMPVYQGCTQCDTTCKGYYIPCTVGETCGAPGQCSKPKHCNGFCPCFKGGKPDKTQEDIASEQPAVPGVPEVDEGIVTLPAVPGVPEVDEGIVTLPAVPGVPEVDGGIITFPAEGGNAIGSNPTKRYID